MIPDKTEVKGLVFFDLLGNDLHENSNPFILPIRDPLWDPPRLKIMKFLNPNVLKNVKIS